jgi:hypothetical protein
VPRALPGVRLGRARADRCRDAEASSGAREADPGARAVPPRCRRVAAARRRARRARTLPRRRAAVLVGTQMVAKGTTFPGSRSPPWSTRTRVSRCPTSAPRSAPSSSSRSSPGEAAATPPAASSCRPSSPTRRRFATRRTTTCRAFSPASSSAARRSATRRTVIWSRSSSRGRRPTRPSPRCGSCARGSRGAGAEGNLLGPAPVLRLRGRYRAQLVAKTTQPRSVARHASTLLAAAARTMRQGRPHRSRRRRPPVAVEHAGWTTASPR